MSRVDTILDLDDSASSLPAVVQLTAGFPSENLLGLYLFEDSTVGSTMTTALDSSGNGKHATALSGSSAIRIAEGIKSGDALNNGFLFDAPIDYAGSYTVCGVIRNRVPVSTTGSYPVIHGKSNYYGSNGVNSGFVQATVTANGALFLNNDATSANDNSNISLLNGKGAGGAWTGAPSGRPGGTVVAPRATWEAFALSINATTGELILRAAGSTLTFTSLADLTTFLTPAGHHLFGYGRYATANAILGDMGLFGIYAGIKDVTALDVLNTASKSRMALRGVTAA